MAKNSALTNPTIEDREALDEYLDDLTDLAPKIERDVAALKQNPVDKEVISNLFRTLHNIKGDAALCKVQMGVLVSHPLETLLGRLRTGELRFTAMLGEIILLSVDRLELAVETLSAGKPLAHLQLDQLVSGLEQLSHSTQSELDTIIAGVIKSVTGFSPNAAKLHGRNLGLITPRSPEEITSDLRFFASLARQFESRSVHFEGRCARTLRLAIETNEAAGKPVDPVQLEAAVYMHDAGMMFLPESVWLKLERLTDSDKRALHAHPGFGAGLLERMESWESAAEIVAQHHEMPDGAGYPNGLKGDQICAGAKIMAIVDAFEAVMLKHTHRGHSRSLLRAIAEVNACNNQFAAEWIEPFNSVIRNMIEA